MVSQTNLRRAEALRLLSQTCSLESIVADLIIDRVLTGQDLTSVRNSYCKHEELCIILHRAEVAGKITLLWYEWQVLPELRIKLQVVSSAGVRVWEHLE